MKKKKKKLCGNPLIQHSKITQKQKQKRITTN